MKLFLLGSIAFDEILHFPGRFQDVLKNDHLDKLSACFVVEDQSTCLGGTAGNIAYGLGLLGGHALLCSPLGEDGASYKKLMADWGMDTSHVDVITGEKTAKAQMTTDAENHQISHFMPGVIGSRAPGFQLPESAEAGDWLMVTPENKGRMMAAIEQGQEAGLNVIFDPGQLIHTFTKEELEALLPRVKMLIVNAYEWELAKGILGYEPEVETLIVTRSEKGADFIHEGEVQHQEAFPIDAVADPTGAGDAFRAGLLFGMQKGMNLAESVELGALMGAACAAHPTTQGYSLENFDSQRAALLDSK